ncbi:hypothetical protein NZD89_09560 [Alicyclobacillus fastidiosus]|uniref:Zinc-finger domain-containing protein n=1 Tax=Alicyclobacillus fastidiosus TaxID=392011 RepID=A0ABY6ZL78_9BACL|nr:hypothetical protein [Alicyclobacillus fastidiosus]WAH43599.1 hypothetical protein NZD89_09560 [Alicyclobacillus fastidiosus]GMA59785.1 hypothetical protein GCM10025859_02250 [Alicyclobacillus fastidiosus]
MAITRDECKSCLDYALGEIHDELRRKRYERHLKTCPSCQRDLLEYREIIRDLHRPEDAVTEVQFTANRTKLVAFPRGRSPQGAGRTPIFVRLSRASMTLSVSATAAIMALAMLIHTGHFLHLGTIGDSALDHMSHTVLSGGRHLAHDIHRI